jgi:excisionase family DNA binding protein
MTQGIGMPTGTAPIARAITRYLTTDEVAEITRTPAETVRYWRHVGKGPKSFKLGRRVLYAAEDVETFIEEARTEQAIA